MSAAAVAPPEPSAPLPDVGVGRTLARSRAHLLRAAALGEGCSLAAWANADDRVRYEAPEHHTVSVYLAGGYGTRRADHPSRRGAPGRLCLLPAGERSDWIVDGALAFLHLYLPPAAFARAVVEVLDREPRSAGLLDAVYVDDAAAAGAAARLAALDWQAWPGRLALDEVVHELLAHLVARYVCHRPLPEVRGGLAPAVLRRVLDYLDAHLERAPGLDELAAVAHLSPYHFARMFQRSTGSAPHAWLAARRLARARALLRGTLPLAAVAAACGYASQSHLGNAFRHATGVTPGQYRRWAHGHADAGGEDGGSA